jgi:hypothetical protein
MFVVALTTTAAVVAAPPVPAPNLIADCGYEIDV